MDEQPQVEEAVEEQPKPPVVEALPDTADLVTVEEAVLIFRERGLPRHMRTIQKYCSRTTGRVLVSYQVPTENGIRYMIERASIDRFIADAAQQLADLFSVTCQGINKRLKLLFHHHYLGKLPAKLSPKLFNSPDIYFINLDRRAAKVLREREVSLPHQKRSNLKQPKHEHLQHTLLTNDILIAFELAARNNPQIEFLSSQQLLTQSSNEDRKKLAHPWKVTAFLPERNISRCAYPDAAFALFDKRTDKTQLYLIEADRMTQPLMRYSKRLFRVSNIKAKLIIYHTAWKQGVFRENFGHPATHILFVTLSAERAEHMQTLATEQFAGRASGLFIFIEVKGLSIAANEQ